MASKEPVPHNLRKIEKFMEKVKKDPPVMRPNYDNIYILSDSKGKYLKGIRYNIADVIRHANVSQLHFWFKNGQKSADGLRYLESQTNNLRRPGRTIVLFWHVTCDLSTLKRPERYIVNSFETAGELLEHLRPTFDGLEEIHKRANFDIGILETPPIFWHKWNQQHGDTDWEGKDDTLMHSQVNAVNEYIRGVNQRLNYRSPMFICDCMEFRKSKGQHGHRQSLTSELFSDGVHPLEPVCEKWLYQIIKSVSEIQESGSSNS